MASNEAWRKWAEEEATTITEVARGADVGRDAAAMLLASSHIMSAMQMYREVVASHWERSKPVVDAMQESVAEIRRIKDDDSGWKGEAS